MDLKTFSKGDLVIRSDKTKTGILIQKFNGSDAVWLVLSNNKVEIWSIAKFEGLNNE